MASYARDIFFAVRVEDRATRPLRRIARDFQMLGKQGLAARQADVRAAQRAYAGSRASYRQSRARYQDLVIQGQQISATRKQTAADAALLESTLKRGGVLRRLGPLYQRQTQLTEKAREAELALQQLAVRRGLKTPESILAQQGKKEGYTAQEARRILGPQLILPGVAEKNIQAKYRDIQTSLGSITTKEKEFAATLGISAKQLQEQYRAVVAYQVALDELAVAEKRNASATEVAALRRKAAREQLRLSKQDLVASEAALRRFPIDRLQGIFTYFLHAGALLTTFGVAATAAFGIAGKAAADFSTQATLAATQSTVAGQNTVKQVQKNSAVIQAEIQKLLQSGKVISTPSEQTRAAYEIFSGIALPGNQTEQLKEGVGLLREFNKLTVANVGLVSLEESTKAGIVLINRFGDSLKRVPKDLNTMQAAVRFGRITLSEFIGTLNQAAPAAQAAGYTFPQMASSIAFLSKQFPSVRMGAAGYARLLEIFGRRDVIDALKQHGVQISTIRNGVEKLLPLDKIASNILAKYGTQAKSGSVFIQNFFKSIGAGTAGTIQARRVLQAYLQKLDQAKQTARDVTSDNNELAKSYRAAQVSPGVRLKEFENQLKALGLAIGMGVIPAIAHLTPYVKGLADYISNLSPHTKNLIGYFGALTAALLLFFGILALGVGTLGRLSIGFATLFGAGKSKNFDTFIKGAGNARTSLAGLGTEVGSITPKMLGLLSPALIAPIIIFHKQIGELIGSLGGLHNVIVLVGGALTGLAFTKLIGNLSTLSFGFRGVLTSMGLLLAAFLVLKQGISGADSLWSAWTHSTTTVIAGLGIMITVVYKLTSAIKELAASAVAAKLAGAFVGGSEALSAGIGSFLFRGGAGRAAAKAAPYAGQVVLPAGVEAGAIGAEAGLGGLAAAAGGLGTVLPVVGVGVAALAGGLYLLHRRADEAKQKAAELAKEQMELNKQLREGVQAAQNFGQAGQYLRQVASAGLDLQDVNAQIAEARDQLRNAPRGSSDRTDLQRQLNRLLLQRADIIDQLSSAWNKYYTASGDVGTTLRKQRLYNADIARTEERLKGLRALLAEVTRTGGKYLGERRTAQVQQQFGIGLRASPRDIQRVQDAIDRAEVRLRRFRNTSQEVGVTFTNSIRKILVDLQHANLVPGRRITEGMVADVEHITRRVGHMLTPGELKLIVRAEINPNRPPAGLAQWVARYIRRRYNIRARIQLNIDEAQRKWEQFSRNRLTRLHIARAKVTLAIREALAHWGRFSSVILLRRLQHKRVRIDLEIRQALANWRAFTKAVGGFYPKTLDVGIGPRRDPSKPQRSVFSGAKPRDVRTVNEWIDLIIKAHRQAEKVGTLAAWRRYYSLQTQLGKKFSGDQLQAIQELINARESAGKKAAKYSDAQILAEARRVHKLEQYAKNHKTFAAWKAYYAALATLQSRASDAQMQAIDQILNVSSSKVNKAANDAKQKIDAMLSNLQSMYNDFLQRNQEAFGTLFQGPFEQSAVIQDKMAYGYKLTARDMLRDLQSQVAQFRRFNNELALLQRRGAPPELINQLRQLGPEALPQIEMLAKSSPKIWKAYVAEFNKSQQLIKRETMRQLRAQIQMYRRQGKNIALAILSGMQSQDKKLIRWLRSLIAQMFPDLARQARNAAPSRPRRRDLTQTRRTARQTAPRRPTTRRSTTRRPRETRRPEPAPRQRPGTQRRPVSQQKQYTTMSYVDDAPSRYRATAALQQTARTHASTMRDMHQAAAAQARHAFRGNLGYFRNYGRRVGLAILAGLRSTTPAYRAWLKNVFGEVPGVNLPNVQNVPPRRVITQLQQAAPPRRTITRQIRQTPPARPQQIRIVQQVAPPPRRAAMLIREVRPLQPRRAEPRRRQQQPQQRMQVMRRQQPRVAPARAMAAQARPIRQIFQPRVVRQVRDVRPPRPIIRQVRQIVQPRVLVRLIQPRIREMHSHTQTNTTRHREVIHTNTRPIRQILHPVIIRQARDVRPPRPIIRQVRQIIQPRVLVRIIQPRIREMRSHTQTNTNRTREIIHTQTRTPHTIQQPKTETKHIEYHDHYEITAPKGEHDSVLKQAKHAAWHAKTRHRHRD